MNTFFEGPEKKIELMLKPGTPSLRALDRTFWSSVVRAAGAQILSEIRSDECTAYLLSESSLFVYDDHLTMITCGRTTLVDAAVKVLERVSKDDVALVIFERKNEHFPEQQPSTFYDDARRLKALFSGRGLCFGDEHAHRVHMFAWSSGAPPEPDDTTLEILMHGLDPERAALFAGAQGNVAVQTGIDRIISGSKIDEHCFTPAGYSMNALAGRTYFTVHVTPEQPVSFASFETNLDFRDNLAEITKRVTDVFRPRSFTMVTFSPTTAPTLKLDGFEVEDHVASTLAGYRVDFRHCFRPPTDPRRPSVIDL